MSWIKASAVTIALVIQTACTTNVLPVPSDEVLPGFFPVSSTNLLNVGSAVQWNEEYAVSAAHIPQLPNVEYHCSTGCDLVFIRRKAEGAVPDWRAAVTGERVKTAGINSLMLTVKGVGTNNGQRVRLDSKSDRGIYVLSDAPVADGMSGGPVYGSDNAVVGMTVGIFVPYTLSPNDTRQHKKTMTTYVPYEAIRHEWKLFSQGKLATRVGGASGVPKVSERLKVSARAL
ncbi:hypothetical protein [Pseudomonas koreensis]|uniref:hypothetical protein n=1 Tax=Pseudomonas koreensis TaxID=198620 RepID=UPI00380EC069